MPDEPSRPENISWSPGRLVDDAAAEDMVRDNIGWMLALAERLLRDRGLAEDLISAILESRRQ
jgi:hypothetical protein